MKDPKRVWVWVGVVVVAAAVAGWAVWASSPKQPVASQSGPAPVFAPQGQLVPEFPKGLILDSTAAISGSYSINYASSTNQYTAEYNSSSSMASLYAQYKQYLPANGWTITGTLTTHPTFNVIAASQGNNQLQVVVNTQSKGSQVTITYVAQ